MLDITDHLVGDVTVVTLKGRLAPEDGETPLSGLIDRLLRENRTKLVLDLRDVTYIDSAGLGLLVAKYVGVRRRGGDLRLVHLTARSTHLMAITKLAAVFGTFDSEAAAVESFAAS
jgi:anti-sigma B factor antagonist